MQFTTTSGFSVQIKDFRTRKLDREYQEAVSDGLLVGADGTMTPIPAKNVQKANDILVAGMTGLSQEEIDSLSMADYNEILTKITEEEAKKSPAKKS